MSNRSALVSLSGGMDSATVLGAAVQAVGSQNVRTIGFFYGSKHNPYENEAAVQLARHYEVPFELIDLTAITKHFRSHLLANEGSLGDVPEGHYEEETMRQTVVPGRNLLFISILAGIAQSHGLKEIWLGIHAGDHFIYPDCRPEFFNAANSAVSLAYGVELIAPFLFGNKETILQEGYRLGVPYELTRTCYKAQAVACGKCGSCQERLDAFSKIRRSDPVEYETRELLPKSAP